MPRTTLPDCVIQNNAVIGADGFGREFLKNKSACDGFGREFLEDDHVSDGFGCEVWETPKSMF